MKPTQAGHRVAIVGASSLLGTELRNVLEKRRFPVSRFVTFAADEEEPDLPVVDLQLGRETVGADEKVSAAELDLAFRAAPEPSAGSRALFLRQGGHGPCLWIDLVGGLDEPAFKGPRGVLSVPFLERTARGAGPLPDSKVFISPHPAAIVLSSLLLRLAARFPLKSAVAQILASASEIGSRGVEELQKQTVSLLSFQKIPQNVFGAQLGFNLLTRLPGRRGGALAEIENRIRGQLREYLRDRAPLPALRLYLAPIFYSLGLSLYLETAQPTAPEALAGALAGEGIHVRKPAESAPSQVEAAGSSDILVDAITPDPDHPAGIWIWAVVDNIRLAALNAVEIAEALGRRIGSE